MLLEVVGTICYAIAGKCQQAVYTISMLESELFTKAAKESPKDEEALNAKLLIRAGFVQKLFAGVYSFLPLGLRVLKNIESIIREEMNKVGGQEILMPALHPIANYETTGRSKINVLFHTELASGSKLVLGQSHEEIVVPLVKHFVQSYKDLPLAVYQIQTKFRNELRAKSGLLRGREFIMKDLYSFHLDEGDFDVFYEKMKGAYRAIFERVGIGEDTYLTYASGGTFSEFSDEFQTLTDSGEDTIYICDKCKRAINKEIKEKYATCPDCSGKKFAEKTAIEVANIFPLKTKFSDAFNLRVKGEQGKEVPVIMGCYGMGLTRLLGTIVEKNADEHGMIWPTAVAPFKVHLLTIGEAAQAKGASLYNKLQKHGISVLYDNRGDVSPGQKFAEADLIGIPSRVVISDKTGDKIELKRRNEKEAKLVTEKELLGLLSNS